MRYFQRLVVQLKETIDITTPGDLLKPPKLMNSLYLNGRKAYYVHMGMGNSGPAIIMLHGFGGFFMDWPRVMVPLAKKFHVFALDLPGWGFSQPPIKTQGLEDHIKFIQQFIEAAGLREVVLVGMSYGAAVAWGAAAGRIPEIKKIVLINPMPPRPLDFMHSVLYRLIFNVNKNKMISKFTHKCLTEAQYKLVVIENLKHKRLLDTFYFQLGYLVTKQPYIGESIHNFAKLSKKIDWVGWEKKLKNIDVPVTIMQGEDDKIFSVKSAEYLQSLIPNAELIKVPSCGHAMAFDQHKKITQLLMSIEA